MTTVITRLYADERSALHAADKLRWEGFPRYALQVISGTDAGDLKRRILRAMVGDDLAGGYAKDVSGGKALLVVRATYKPLGAARIARQVVGSAKAPNAVGPMGEGFVKDGPDHAPSILKDHPLIASLPVDIYDYKPGPVSDELGLRLLSPRKARTSAMRGTRFMSRAFWPMALLSKRRKATSAMQGTRHMSALFWPMPLVSTKPRRNSVIRGGALPFSNLFGWSPISRS